MRRLTSVFVLLTFLVNCVLPSGSFAQNVSLPQPGVMVPLSAKFEPALMVGLKVDPQDPFKMSFIMDRGESELTADQERAEFNRVIKYFLTALTVPNTDMWVNLSPFEKDRIIPDNFGQTEMGRDLLASDYLLKQIMATSLFPDSESGKQFWAEVYRQAAEKFGTTDIPVDTFNKVWIIPDKAVVMEKDGVALVMESRLKVMLESDYVAFERSNVIRHTSNDSHDVKRLPAGQAGMTNAKGTDFSKEILRDIVIPLLEREVNEGEHFAQLRQVYSGMLLATYFKKSLKEGILGQVYADKSKVNGVDLPTSKEEREKIYQQYLDAYKTGVFNFIKDEVDPVSGESLPRKYFSGGTSSYDFAMIQTINTPTRNGGAIIHRLMNASRLMVVAAALTSSANAGVIAAFDREERIPEKRIDQITQQFSSTFSSYRTMLPIETQDRLGDQPAVQKLADEMFSLTKAMSDSEVLGLDFVRMVTANYYYLPIQKMLLETMLKIGEDRGTNVQHEIVLKAVVAMQSEISSNSGRSASSYALFGRFFLDALNSSRVHLDEPVRQEMKELLKILASLIQDERDSMDARAASDNEHSDKQALMQEAFDKIKSYAPKHVELLGTNVVKVEILGNSRVIQTNTTTLPDGTKRTITISQSASYTDEQRLIMAVAEKIFDLLVVKKGKETNWVQTVMPNMIVQNHWENAEYRNEPRMTREELTEAVKEEAAALFREDYMSFVTSGAPSASHWVNNAGYDSSDNARARKGFFQEHVFTNGEIKDHYTEEDRDEQLTRLKNALQDRNPVRAVFQGWPTNAPSPEIKIDKVGNDKAQAVVRLTEQKNFVVFKSNGSEEREHKYVGTRHPVIFTFGHFPPDTLINVIQISSQLPPVEPSFIAKWVMGRKPVAETRSMTVVLDAPLDQWAQVRERFRNQVLDDIPYRHADDLRKWVEGNDLQARDRLIAWMNEALKQEPAAETEVEAREAAVDNAQPSRRQTNTIRFLTAMPDEMLVQSLNSANREALNLYFMSKDGRLRRSIAQVMTFFKDTLGPKRSFPEMRNHVAYQEVFRALVSVIMASTAEQNPDMLINLHRLGLMLTSNTPSYFSLQRVLAAQPTEDNLRRLLLAHGDNFYSETQRLAGSAPDTRTADDAMILSVKEALTFMSNVAKNFPDVQRQVPDKIWKDPRFLEIILFDLIANAVISRVNNQATLIEMAASDRPDRAPALAEAISKALRFYHASAQSFSGELTLRNGKVVNEDRGLQVLDLLLPLAEEARKESNPNLLQYLKELNTAVEHDDGTVRLGMERRIGFPSEFLKVYRNLERLAATFRKSGESGVSDMLMVIQQSIEGSGPAAKFVFPFSTGPGNVFTNRLNESKAAFFQRLRRYREHSGADLYARFDDLKYVVKESGIEADQAMVPEALERDLRPLVFDGMRALRSMLDDRYNNAVALVFEELKKQPEISSDIDEIAAEVTRVLMGAEDALNLRPMQIEEAAGRMAFLAYAAFFEYSEEGRRPQADTDKIIQFVIAPQGQSDEGGAQADVRDWAMSVELPPDWGDFVDTAFPDEDMYVPWELRVHMEDLKQAGTFANVIDTLLAASMDAEGETEVFRDYFESREKAGDKGFLNDGLAFFFREALKTIYASLLAEEHKAYGDELQELMNDLGTGNPFAFLTADLLLLEFIAEKADQAMVHISRSDVKDAISRIIASDSLALDKIDIQTLRFEVGAQTVEAARDIVDISRLLQRPFDFMLDMDAHVHPFNPADIRAVVIMNALNNRSVSVLRLTFAGKGGRNFVIGYINQGLPANDAGKQPEGLSVLPEPFVMDPDFDFVELSLGDAPFGFLGSKPIWIRENGNRRKTNWTVKLHDGVEISLSYNYPSKKGFVKFSGIAIKVPVARASYLALKKILEQLSRDKPLAAFLIQREKQFENYEAYLASLADKTSKEGDILAAKLLERANYYRNVFLSENGPDVQGFDEAMKVTVEQAREYLKVVKENYPGFHQIIPDILWEKEEFVAKVRFVLELHKVAAQIVGQEWTELEKARELDINESPRIQSLLTRALQLLKDDDDLASGKTGSRGALDQAMTGRFDEQIAGASGVDVDLIRRAVGLSVNREDFLIAWQQQAEQIDLNEITAEAIRQQVIEALGPVDSPVNSMEFSRELMRRFSQLDLTDLPESWSEVAGIQERSAALGLVLRIGWMLSFTMNWDQMIDIVAAHRSVSRERAFHLLASFAGVMQEHYDYRRRLGLTDDFPDDLRDQAMAGKGIIRPGSLRTTDPAMASQQQIVNGIERHEAPALKSDHAMEAKPVYKLLNGETVSSETLREILTFLLSDENSRQLKVLKDLRSISFSEENVVRLEMDHDVVMSKALEKRLKELVLSIPSEERHLIIPVIRQSIKDEEGRSRFRFPLDDRETFIFRADPGEVVSNFFERLSGYSKIVRRPVVGNHNAGLYEIYENKVTYRLPPGWIEFVDSELVMPQMPPEISFHLQRIREASNLREVIEALMAAREQNDLSDGTSFIPFLLSVLLSQGQWRDNRVLEFFMAAIEEALRDMPADIAEANPQDVVILRSALKFQQPFLIVGLSGSFLQHWTGHAADPSFPLRDQAMAERALRDRFSAGFTDQAMTVSREKAERLLANLEENYPTILRDIVPSGLTKNELFLEVVRRQLEDSERQAAAEYEHALTYSDSTEPRLDATRKVETFLSFCVTVYRWELLARQRQSGEGGGQTSDQAMGNDASEGMLILKSEEALPQAFVAPVLDFLVERANKPSSKLNYFEELRAIKSVTEFADGRVAFGFKAERRETPELILFMRDVQQLIYRTRQLVNGPGKDLVLSVILQSIEGEGAASKFVFPFKPGKENLFTGYPGEERSAFFKRLMAYRKWSSGDIYGTFSGQRFVVRDDFVVYRDKDEAMRKMADRAMTVTFATDDDLAYRELDMKVSEMRINTPAYVARFLRHINPEHPLVLASEYQAAIAADRARGRRMSLVYELSGKRLEESDTYQQLLADIRQTSAFKNNKIAFQADEALHLTIQGSLEKMGQDEAALAREFEQKNLSSFRLQVKGLFVEALDYGRVFLRVYPEKNVDTGVNRLSERMQTLGAKDWLRYTMALFQLRDNLSAEEAAELQEVIDRFKEVVFFDEAVDELSVVSFSNDLMADKKGVSFRLADRAMTQELSFEKMQTLVQDLGLSGAYLFLGHGSKGQFNDVREMETALDEVVGELNARHGKGKWLLVFGGDAKTVNPDLGYLVHRVKEKNPEVPLLAVEADAYRTTRVDAYIDYVYYYPTQRDSEGKILYGGYRDGQLRGSSRFYFSGDYIASSLRGVFAFGGGPVAKEEVSYALSQGLKVAAYKLRPRHRPETGEEFGVLDGWLDQQPAVPNLERRTISDQAMTNDFQKRVGNALLVVREVGDKYLTTLLEHDPRTFEVIAGRMEGPKAIEIKAGGDVMEHLLKGFETALQEGLIEPNHTRPSALSLVVADAMSHFIEHGQRGPLRALTDGVYNLRTKSSQRTVKLKFVNWRPGNRENSLVNFETTKFIRELAEMFIHENSTVRLDISSAVSPAAVPVVINRELTGQIAVWLQRDEKVAAAAEVILRGLKPEVRIVAEPNQSGAVRYRPELRYPSGHVVIGNLLRGRHVKRLSVPSFFHSADVYYPDREEELKGRIPVLVIRFDFARHVRKIVKEIGLKGLSADAVYERFQQIHEKQLEANRFNGEDALVDSLRQLEQELGPSSAEAKKPGKSDRAMKAEAGIDSGLSRTVRAVVSQYLGSSIRVDDDDSDSQQIANAKLQLVEKAERWLVYRGVVVDDDLKNRISGALDGFRQGGIVRLSWKNESSPDTGYEGGLGSDELSILASVTNNGGTVTTEARNAEEARESLLTQLEKITESEVRRNTFHYGDPEKIQAITNRIMAAVDFTLSGEGMGQGYYKAVRFIKEGPLSFDQAMVGPKEVQQFLADLQKNYELIYQKIPDDVRVNPRFLEQLRGMLMADEMWREAAGERHFTLMNLARKTRIDAVDTIEETIDVLLDAYNMTFGIDESGTWPADDAMTSTGGIDFNDANLDLQIKRDGNGMPLPINLQDPKLLDLPGLVPVIINIQKLDPSMLPVLSADLAAEAGASQT